MLLWIAPVLTEAGSMMGEGVWDKGVRELCVEELTVSSGLLRLLDTLTSCLPTKCELRSWSADARVDWRDSNRVLSVSPFWVPSCWVPSCWVPSCWMSG